MSDTLECEKKRESRPISFLDSLKTGVEVDVNMLLTSRKKSSEVLEGCRDDGLSADICATRALMSWADKTILHVLRSTILP